MADHRVSLPAACLRVGQTNVILQWANKNAFNYRIAMIESQCRRYEALLDTVHWPNCSSKSVVVPLVYHAIAGSREPPYTVHSIAAANPAYQLNYHNDATASAYIKNRCGMRVAAAFKCLHPAAFRADLFRYCALYAEGGVYVDADLVLSRPLAHIYSPCSNLTLGHDWPVFKKVFIYGNTSKQIKILAATPRHRIFRCALDSVVSNVAKRATNVHELAITGPLLFEKCFQYLQKVDRHHLSSLAFTYIDARTSAWPFTGMRTRTEQGKDDLLAFEFPKAADFVPKKHLGQIPDYTMDVLHYNVYQLSCSLNTRVRGPHRKFLRRFWRRSTFKQGD
mmetsp:Transcript_75247/g.125478  ORF Transcript_75247/g.125478 Transcript_75247/m.125478 type:complete len:336 (+) Transcript_75247:249-1256(+)